jgi:hypothetical protein
VYNLLSKYTGRLYAPDTGGEGGGAPGEPAPGGTEGAHPVVVAPWAAATDGPWKVGEAGKEQEWWNTIPEPEAREHVKAKGYKNPAELALANFSLTKMQRGASDVIALPGKDASDNDWASYFQKAGRPNAPTDYKFNLEGVQADPKMVEFGQKLFHETGVLPKFADKGVKMWNDFVAEQNAAKVTADQTANAEAVTALEQKWGAELNENKAAGNRVVAALGLSKESMDAIEAHTGAAPLIELLAMIGKKSGEGKLVGGQGGGDPNDPSNMTKEQAQSKINELQADTEFQKSYMDKNHVGHNEAVQRMAKLFART